MFLKRMANATFVAGLVLGLLAAIPASGQGFQYFPGDATTDDGRTVALAGEQIETLAQDSMGFLLVVPPGETMFEIGIFDGDTGGTDGDGKKHWDNGSTQLQYALFYDPMQTGNTDPADLVGVWRGNETNPTSGSLWSADRADFPDNDWWSLMVGVEMPPDPEPGLAPSGVTTYHLCVSYRGATTGGATDPCTGDARPADGSKSTIANFKLRATANISVVAFAFAYEGALRTSGNHDLPHLYPTWTGTLSDPEFFLTAPSSYDGSWTFSIDVPVSTEVVELFDGDFDYGTDPADPAGFPSGADMFVCADANDPDTPDDACFPGFAVADPASDCSRLDDSLPEGARTSGSPPDDNRFDVFRRDDCVTYRVTSPGPDGDPDTVVDNFVYDNFNPSSQREWEQFRISSEPDCDDGLGCDPASSNCADYCETEPLWPGEWRAEVFGVDLSNLNAWRAAFGFCTNCLPSRPYLIGDTVFADYDGDGVQQEFDFGIEGVVLELVDGFDRVLATLDTNDAGAYPSPGHWAACQARNTGGATVDGVPIDEGGLYCFGVAVPNLDPSGPDSQDYTVRVAASNFSPGGAIHDFLGGAPVATRTSPSQTDTVVEGGDNVMTYDFGYWLGTCGPCEGKASHLTFRYQGASGAQVRIERKAGGSNDVLFDDFLEPDDIFSIFGPAGGGGFGGTLGTEITIFVDDVEHVQIHTSCSQPLGPGQVWGDFLILAGSSKEGGPFCPLGEDTAASGDGGGDSGDTGGGGKTKIRGKAK